MKKFSIYLVLLGLVLLTNVQTSFSQNVNVSGAVVGNGTYVDLASAFTAINGGAQGGAVIVIDIVNNTTEPAGGAILNAGTWTSVLIRPQGGNYTVTGAATAGLPLVDLNGADNVTIDGLNSGGNALIISNTTISATSGTSTIRFINDATNNIITNCSILGSSTMATGTNGGNVYFAAGAISTGNDNNTVSFCNIGPAGANSPTKGVYSSGTTTTTALNNSGIVVTNNNIFDCFGAAVSSSGVHIVGGSTDINILNNRIYQTASRTQTTGAQHSGISINNTSGNNFLVSGNTIGYNTSLGTGTYTFVGTSSSVLIPIFLSVGTTTATSVQGNIITNIAMSGSASGTSSSAPFRGIYISSGLVNVGNVLGNLVGSTTVTGAISYTSSSASGSDVIGVFNFGSSNSNFSNNIVAGITAGNTSTGGGNIYGLRINTSSAANSTVTNNQIGSSVIGSFQSTGAGSSTIIGIQISTSAATITGNTIGSFASASGTGTGSTPALAGIVVNATSNNHTVTGNTITSIGSPSPGVTGNITGIFFNSGSGTNVVSKNNINSFAAASATATIIGINTSGGTCTYSNNMIRLGLDPSGASVATGCSIQGLNETGGTNNYYHNNSVYVGGTGVTGTANTFAFQSTVTVNTRNYVNNIFVNARSNGAGTGKHYGIRVGGTAPNPGGLVTNFNDIFVSGTGGVLGLFNAIDQANLAAWQTATGQDGASSSADPQYLNPTGSAITGDLHINAVTPTVVEQGGVLIPAITDDIDNQVRAGLTPTDLGADAGNFTVITCSAANGGAIAPTSYTRCENQTQVLTSIGATAGVGITYQWMVSGTPGGPYINVSGGSGATTTSYTTGPLAAGTFYYVMQTTCSAGPITGLSNEVTVTVNALPTVLATPASSSYCIGDAGISIDATGTGGVTYTWLPAAGLSSTTGTPVVATPSVTTTYTVTATDGAGCTNTATSLMNSSFNPIIVDISATPSSVCSGGNSQLLAASFIPSPVNGYAFSTSTGAVLDPMTGATTVIGSGVDDAVTGAPAAIGFNFNYNGTSYTQYSVSPDGWIVLGGAVAVDDFSNQVTDPTNIPKIYPYWDDIATGTTGNVQTLVTGTAPNRIFIVQWFVTVPRATGGPANSTFQAWLYEADGKIEFRYGTMGAAGMASSVGLTGSITNFNCVTIASNTNSTSVTNDANAGQPASGRMYTFTPPVPTYLWTPATFLSSTTINNPMANAVTSTTTYTVTATNGGCSATASTTITSGVALTSSAITTNSPVCQGADIIATANPSGGGAPYTYSWDIDGGTPFISPTATVTIPGLAPGAYTLNSLVTDACLATTSQSISITVDPTPTASASSNSPVCVGDAINLTGTTDIGAVFNWSGPDSYTSTSQSPSLPSSTTLMSGTYSFTSTLGSCTSAVATTVVAVNPNPTSVTAAATSNTICNGATIDLSSSASLGGNILVENFNGVAAGWTIINNSAGGTPAAATWTLRPNGYNTGGAWGATINSNDNTQFILSNSDAQGSGSTTNTILQSPSFNTVGLTSLDLQFYHYYRASGDAANVEVSTDGLAWTSVQTYTTTTGAPASFVVENLNLNPYIGNPTLYVRFHYTSAWGYGWAVDNVTVSGTASPVTFAWTSSPAGFTSPVQNPTGVAPTITTDYTVTATNSFGCTATASTTVTVNPLPTPTANNTGDYCEGETIQLNSPTGSATDDWSGPSYTQADIQNPTIASSTVAMSGDYTVTVTDGNGCSATATTTVVVNPAPTVSATNTGPYCEGETIQLNSVGGTATDDWSGPSYTQADTQNPTIASSTVAMSGDYTVTVTAVNGCSATATTTVVVNALPTPTANNTGPYCEGTTIQLNSPTGSATDDWSGPLYTQADTQNPTIASSTVAMSGDYTVTVTDGNGCSATATTTVVVNTLPTPTANNTGDYCEGETIQLNSPTGSATDDWSGPSYTQADTQNPTIASSTVAMSGDYTVTVTDGNGCSATATTTVVVNPAPTVSATNTGPYCEGETIQLNSVGGTATDDWSGPSYTQADIQNPTIASSTVAMSGDYTVTVTAVNGCSATATTTVVVNALPTPTANNTGPYCEGTTIQLNSPTGSATDDWSGPSYTQADTQNPTIASSTVAMSGDYTVTVTDGNGCSATATTTVVVNAAPTPTATNTGPYCEGATIQLNSPSGSATDDWSGPSYTSTDTQNPTIASSTIAMSGVYTVTVTNGAGCSATATTTVVVNAQPSVNLGADVVQANPPAILDAGAGFATYLWSTTETTQTISVNTNGQYIVTVTTAGVGCTDSDTINVNFTSGIVNVDGTPTIFSLYPNPTTNGIFNVSINNIETTNLVMEVMDMNGSVVHNKYIGSANGNVIEPFSLTELSMGTYIIRITANGKSTQLRFIINK